MQKSWKYFLIHEFGNSSNQIWHINRNIHIGINKWYIAFDTLVSQFLIENEIEMSGPRESMTLILCLPSLFKGGFYNQM